MRSFVGDGALDVPFFGFAICVVVGGCFREEQFSLRLGHTRVLTSHRDVIHYARVASLPPLQKMGTFAVCVALGVRL